MEIDEVVEKVVVVEEVTTVTAGDAVTGGSLEAAIVVTAATAPSAVEVALLRQRAGEDIQGSVENAIEGRRSNLSSHSTRTKEGF